MEVEEVRRYQNEALDRKNNTKNKIEKLYTEILKSVYKEAKEGEGEVLVYITFIDKEVLEVVLERLELEGFYTVQESYFSFRHFKKRKTLKIAWAKNLISYYRYAN